MADKRIQDLTPASSVQTSDRFVLEQSGQAKSLTGQILINDLATALDGHGGINNISYTAPSSGSLTGTLTVTLADGTTESFGVENGRGISDISFVESSGLVDTYQINYNDDSEPTTFTVTNGEKGDTGDNWYVHIKWSATEPTQDSDMSDTPDNWIGIYSGLGETAPTSYTEYTWFEYKGATGDTGNGIESISLYSSVGVVDTYRVLFTNGSSTTFEVTNGSNISSITKTSSAGLTDTYTVTLTNGDTTSFTVSNAKSITSITPPGNPGLPGQTDRYIINFNNGDTTFFDVYNGTNGTGSVSLVDNIAPVGGSVPLLTFGNGAPTVDTPGSVKSRYFDTLNNQLYICVAVDEESTPNTYTWRGSSVTVDSVLSTTSTNPVQNAVLTAIIGTTPLDTTAQTLTEAVNEILDDISGFADNIAEEYDAAATYAVGDLCIYDNVLYCCNAAITTPEAWNSIHWTQTSVADEIDTVADDLDTAVSGIDSIIGNTALPTTAQTLTGAIAEIDGDVSGKVSKAGDTMTGNLELSNSGLHIKNTSYASQDTPSSSSMRYVYFRDKNDHNIAYFGSNISSSGKSGMILAAGRQVESSSTPGTYSQVENVVGLYVDSNGNRTVDITNAASKAAWRSALGLGTSGALPITIAQGGTDATDKKTAAKNFDLRPVYDGNITSSNTLTLTVSGFTVCRLSFFGGAIANNGEYLVYYGSASGTPVVTEIKAASNITITGSAGKITVKTSAGAAYYEVQTLNQMAAERLTITKT